MKLALIALILLSGCVKDKTHHCRTVHTGEQVAEGHPQTTTDCGPDVTQAPVHNDPMLHHDHATQ